MKYGSTISKLKNHCGPYAAQVLSSTRMSDAELSEAILYEGLEFITRFPSTSRKMAYSRPFWNWFKMQWYSFDAQFFAETQKADQNKNNYLHFHSKMLVNACMPQSLMEIISKQPNPEN